MLDIRQSKNYADYLSSIGWIVERIDNVNYFIKKFPLIGSVIKIQRPEHLDIQTTRQLGKKYKTFQIIIEPKNLNDVLRIRNHGFRISKSPYLPTKTLELDLTKSEKELLKNLKKDCRLTIKKNNELRIMNYGKNINEFRNAWIKSVGLKRYVPPLFHLLAMRKSFKGNCIFLCSKNFNDSNRRSDINSGAIFLIADKTAYYWQAFTDKEGRRKQIQYKIVWEGILWAKKSGAKVFDFEGIYDERFPNKSWLGFTHFKKSFGGKEIEYPGCYTKFQLPI
jgi:hypothetical protein